MSTYRVTSPDGPETVTVPEQLVTVPAYEVTLTPRDWKVERDGEWLGTVSIRGVRDYGWLAIWFMGDSPLGSDSSDHATRDEAVAAVVAGTDR